MFILSWSFHIWVCRYNKYLYFHVDTWIPSHTWHKHMPKNFKPKWLDVSSVVCSWHPIIITLCHLIRGLVALYHLIRGLVTLYHIIRGLPDSVSAWVTFHSSFLLFTNNTGTVDLLMNNFAQIWPICRISSLVWTFWFKDMFKLSLEIGSCFQPGFS